jgi:DNA-directed RNA polymerase specialized sigma24 family protein
MEIEDETINPNETEEELVHRLTRRITRSALDRFRRARRRSSTASITLEPIQEHPSPPPPPASSSLPVPTVQPILCHQDFFNDFSGKLYFSDDVELKKDDLTESINE